VGKAGGQQVSRSTPEWIGKTDDTAIPPRVKIRVFQAFGGICQESQRKITSADKWECDHTIALVNGGENRESNLRPLLKAEHKKKTANDVALKAKIDRVRKKHLGIYQPKKPPSKYKQKIGGGTVLRDEA
jgi:5-methylcytosine-specific restriction protein A